MRRCGNDEPDCMPNWIVPFMSISLLLKHLNTPSDFSGSFNGFLFILRSFCFAQDVSLFMKLFGLPVSTRQFIVLLFFFFFIQSSPLLVLLISVTFSCVKLIQLKLTFCQFFVISFMQHFASGSIDSSVVPCSVSVYCSFMSDFS